MLLTNNCDCYRLVATTCRALFLAPVTKATVEDAVQVSLSFDGVSIQPNQPPAILYWNAGAHTIIYTICSIFLLYVSVQYFHIIPTLARTIIGHPSRA